MKKKIISAILSLCLVFSVFSYAPITSQAETNGVKNDNVVTTKTVTQTPDADGNYTINIEAYTTGTVTGGGESVASDIVLVLDQSGSMDYRFGTTKDTNQEAMQKAVKEFITSVKDSGAGHKISIVTFASNAKTVSELSSDYDGLITKIDNLPTPNGATEIDDGMEAAYNILKDSTAEGKIAIAFTDGVPTSSNSFSDTVANNAIKWSKSIKGLTGGAVYSVGIFDGADADDTYGAQASYWSGTASSGKTLVRNNNGVTGDYWDGDDSNYADVKVNRFMSLLSSNSKTATDLGLTTQTVTYDYFWFIFYIPSTYTATKISNDYGLKNDGYYISASDTSELVDAFKDISNDITVPAITLGDKAYLKDSIAPSFELVEGSIVVQEAEKTASDWAAPTASSATYSIEGKNIKVSGFNFDDNCVTTEPKPGTNDDYGSKIMLTFKIKPVDGFIGGDNIPTNGDDSGVYDDHGIIVENFDIPTVNIRVDKDKDGVADKHAIATFDKTIYLSNVIKAGDLVDASSLDGVKNGFVDLKYIIKDEDGNVAGSFTIPAGATNVPAATQDLYLSDDMTYTVSCNVDTPSTSTPCTEKDANVYVLKPVATTNDIWVDYGTEVTAEEFNDNCVGAITWAYPGDATGIPEVTGDVPTTATDVATATYNEETVVPVNLVVTGDVTVDCPIDDVTVYLNTYNLTLTKEVDAADYAKNPQSFAFSVKDADTNINILMNPGQFEFGKATETINGLLCGKPISVKENAEVSWRYALDEMTYTIGGETVAFDGEVDFDITSAKISTSKPATQTVEVTVKNVIAEDKYMSFESIIKNVFNGIR